MRVRGRLLQFLLTALVAAGATGAPDNEVASSGPAAEAPAVEAIRVMDELAVSMAARRVAGGSFGCADCYENHPQCILLDPDKPHAFIDGGGPYLDAGGSFCFGAGDDCGFLIPCFSAAATLEDVPLLLRELDAIPPEKLGQWLMSRSAMASYFPASGAILLLGCDGIVLAVRHLSLDAITAVEDLLNGKVQP